MSYLLSWDWPFLLKTAVGAGVGSAAVQGALSLYRDYRTKDDHAAYLALRLAVILEAYASACFDFVADNANAQQRPDEQFPDWSCTIPLLAEYPIDFEGWRSLDRDLVAKALNLPNKIHGSQGVIRANVDFAMDDDIIYTLDKHACERGLEALLLARSLRSTYDLGAFDPVFDFSESLLTSLQEAEKSLKESQERQQEMIAAMGTPFVRSDL